ncbi:hypothetical protein [Arthrobacter bambusae]|uniref:hypothetical protein n=1 Tax=Arthrobacter bambusae TaxID=1338426 RepID=UPI0027863FEF|nr:hypothetical protein [Arthrobacter bambusae]MDQ0212565.1 hypothetical protein [Arthrobacter bambusae]MDQ0236947.1 hypothetical protein [Arthrobacter bambusae]
MNSEGRKSLAAGFAVALALSLVTACGSFGGSSPPISTPPSTTSPPTVTPPMTTPPPTTPPTTTPLGFFDPVPGVPVVSLGHPATLVWTEANPADSQNIVVVGIHQYTRKVSFTITLNSVTISADDPSVYADQNYVAFHEGVGFLASLGSPMHQWVMLNLTIQSNMVDPGAYNPLSPNSPLAADRADPMFREWISTSPADASSTHCALPLYSPGTMSGSVDPFIGIGPPLPPNSNWLMERKDSSALASPLVQSDHFPMIDPSKPGEDIKKGYVLYAVPIGQGELQVVDEGFPPGTMKDFTQCGATTHVLGVLRYQ